MARTRTYGTVELVDGKWRVSAEPQVMLALKRHCARISKTEFGTVTLEDTEENGRMLDWFLYRYPMSMEDDVAEWLSSQAHSHKARLERFEEIVDPDYKPRRFGLALPPRDYQAVATELYLNRGFLLCGDDVGLGKTVVGIASFCDQRTLPALVVCLTHLQEQWKREIAKFAPELYVHILKKMSPYQLPKRDGLSPDVIICPYSKIRGWGDALSGHVRSVVFDECQELRKNTSQKYYAAREIARKVDFALGLSATPIHNHGGEIWNVFDVLRKDSLGSFDEFDREWCGRLRHDSYYLHEPKAFGSMLREHHMMIRRTRAEVGRELPPLQEMTEFVDSNPVGFDKNDSAADALAKLILDSGEMKTTHRKKKTRISA